MQIRIDWDAENAQSRWQELLRTLANNAYAELDIAWDTQDDPTELHREHLSHVRDLYELYTRLLNATIITKAEDL